LVSKGRCIRTIRLGSPHISPLADRRALKLRLPGLTGTMSIGFVFDLLGIAELTVPEIG